MSNIQSVLDGRDRWHVEERDALAVLAELPDACVDAVITDPPYGINFQSAWCKDGPRFDKIIGDDWPLVDFLPHAVRVMREGSGLFVFCEWRHAEAFRIAIERTGVTIRSQCVWDRGTHGMGNLAAAFAPSHDLAWFATKGDGFAFNGERPRTVMNFTRTSPPSRLVHPAEKPVGLMRHLVSRLSRPDDVVLDPFCGSGSTGAAAVMEGRRAILCEIAREHAFTARRRLEAADAVTDHRKPQQGGLFAVKKKLPKEGLTT